MESMLVHRLSTLGHPQRLAVFRLLMRRFPDRVPASEIAQALGLKPNTLSSYVGALMQAGLISQQRVGTSLRYAIDMDAAGEAFWDLLGDCCRGRPEICAPLMPVSPEGADTGRKQNVLFICTGNSARSVMAEAILRRDAGDRFTAYSAGTRPRKAPHPAALEVLRAKGHDLSGLHSKALSGLQNDEAPNFDFVITVCDRAANEDCMAWPGQPICGHWGMPAPAHTGGPEDETASAFAQTYETLLGRIRDFAALPLAQLDAVAVQRAVDEIAHTHQGAAK
ncbi:MAG: helix-turn-helix domain-containing protein [Pseudomonadota bacterium]